MSIALSVKFNTLPAVVEKGTERHPDVATLALVLRRQQMLRHAVDGSLRNLKTRVVSHRATHGTGGVEHHDDVGRGHGRLRRAGLRAGHVQGQVIGAIICSTARYPGFDPCLSAELTGQNRTESRQVPQIQRFVGLFFIPLCLPYRTSFRP